MTDNTKTIWDTFREQGMTFCRWAWPRLVAFNRWLFNATTKMRGLKPQQIKNGVAGMVLLGAGLMLYTKGGVEPLALAIIVGLGGMFMISALGHDKKQKGANRRTKKTPKKEGR